VEEISMTTNLEIHFSMVEICQVTEVSTEDLIELVEHGIVEPSGDAPDGWVFDACVVGVVKRANRLRRDLDIDWAGIALAVDLLDKLEQLGAENKSLKQRLNRFIPD
jgi:chaperone modulatory protein CbpM